MKKVRYLTAVLTVLILLFLLQRLLMPKYMSAIYEGALIAEYYDEKVNHDVLFIGDCEVYENFSPITLWENYGITSFIRGSAQQLIWQSYYILEESLKMETPKVVVFNVLSMKYDIPQNEAYNRMTLDGMKLSPSKMGAIYASMTEEEDVITYLFPLLRYHARWKELSLDDIKYMFYRDRVSHNGYLMRVDVKPVTTIPKQKPLADYEFSEICYDYLDKMRLLCEEKGVAFVLIKAPSIYPVWYDEWDEQIREYAKKYDLLYLNFLEKMEEIGLDLTCDTYDSGLHLNVSGAEKLSEYFGRILADTYGLSGHMGDKELAKLWGEKEIFYEQQKLAQYAELVEYGYLKSIKVKD